MKRYCSHCHKEFDDRGKVVWVGISTEFGGKPYAQYPICPKCFGELMDTFIVAKEHDEKSETMSWDEYLGMVFEGENK